MTKIVIVGGGVAGFKALQRIRELRPDCDVTLISAEGEKAIERPMLSKEYLQGADVGLRYVGNHPSSDSFIIRAHCLALEIDRSAQFVRTDNGKIAYDRLILATGSRPRRLKLGDGETRSVHYLRTEIDAARLREQIAFEKRVIIIGGGFIGLEVAGSARRSGAKVTVIESQPNLLSRAGPSLLGQHLLKLHQENGVEILTDTRVQDVVQLNSGLIAVSTNNGDVEGDCVVVGVGILPNIELAIDCGLDVDNGIVVDQFCRTSDPMIMAAGEVTNYPVASLGVRTRSECWTTSIDQGAVAAESALDYSGKPYTELPFVWSDQYDTTIQFVGLPMRAPNRHVRAGSTDRSWVEIGVGQDNVFWGAIGVNSNREISELRRAARKGSLIPGKSTREMSAE